MPRPLAQYSPREWRRLKPLVERYKHARYQAQMAIHLRRSAAVGDVAALRRVLAGQQVVVTIAFNDPGFIATQAALIGRYLAECVWLIADNSTDDAAAAAIALVAVQHGRPYLRLRPGPWRRAEDGGRSHGLAMTWVWRHLLRPARPAAFGFIDHDIFPTAPVDPFAPLAACQVAGQVRNRSGRERWYLWAGFCFFRFDAVARRRLNFSLDWAAGLDTGGCNWFSLFRHLAPADVCDTPMALEPVEPDTPVEVARIEWIGPWLHAGAFSTPLSLPAERREALRAKKRALLDRKLAPLLAGTG